MSNKVHKREKVVVEIQLNERIFMADDIVENNKI